MRIRSGVAGLLAAALAVATAELAAAPVAAGRSPLVVVADAIVELTPGAVVRWAIETFASANRLVLALCMATVMVVAAWSIGVATTRRRWFAPVGFAIVAMLGIAASLADPQVPTSSAIAVHAVAAAAGAGALLWLVARAAAGAAEPQAAARTAHAPPARAATAPGGHHGDRAEHAASHGEAPTSPTLPARSRRQFLIGAVSVAGAAAGAGVVGRVWQGRAAVDEARTATALAPPRSPVAPPPAGARLDVEGISPLITPNEAFYRIDTAITAPRIDPAGHTLRLTGMVDRPLEFTYDELLDLADTEAYVTLACVSNEVGGGLVGNAAWQGVPLRRLLDEAGVDPDATQIVGRSVDGWTGGFPIEAAFDGRPALVAVGMNGEPLPLQHGYPVRLVVSGLYGYVSDTKWLVEIELTTFEAYDAYWVPRGWSRFGPIKTQSRIDVPDAGATVDAGEVVVAGVAWADERGVSAVEASVDEGPWQPAELADELAATSWRQWRFVWDASAGDHEIRVRALDADGEPQTRQRTPPAPDGATGLHRIAVAVT